MFRERGRILQWKRGGGKLIAFSVWICSARCVGIYLHCSAAWDKMFRKTATAGACGWRVWVTNAEFTIRDEANALTACAFRGGFLEDLHAGKPSELLTRPGLSRISDEEMRKLMIMASAKLEELLRLKSETLAKYEEWVRDYNLLP